jgi:CheY-like chemotaxis protein
VIEDDPDFARTLMEMARERGFKALVAWEGGAALHLADFYLPSAVLLDLGLPGGMNGLTILTKLKENLNTRHIPVHIISCHEKQREALRMGAVGFLRKPVNLDQLNGVFGRLQSVIAKPIKRLLVVEDNEIQSNSLKELLVDEKVEVVTASSGEEALQAIKKGGFDCIVLDLGLPDISGIELLENLRLSEKEPYVPVIVYTGKELTPEERGLLDKYAERVMVKDVRSPERLLDETALFMHQVENDLPEEKRRVIRMLHDREAIFDGRKVLIVDDDMRNVFALTSVMEEKGLELLVASNGQECLDMLEENPDINLVLMDIMMPVMDGYEAMRRIRSQKRFSKLPIITLTAKAMKGDRAACIEAGASDYLAKPVDTEKLVSMLRVWLYQ